MNDLKPCPFCGETAFMKKDILGISKNHVYKVFCIRCLANIAWENDMNAARESWNKRVPE